MQSLETCKQSYFLASWQMVQSEISHRCPSVVEMHGQPYTHSPISYSVHRKTKWIESGLLFFLFYHCTHTQTTLQFLSWGLASSRNYQEWKRLDVLADWLKTSGNLLLVCSALSHVSTGKCARIPVPSFLCAVPNIYATQTSRFWYVPPIPVTGTVQRTAINMYCNPLLFR